MNIIINSIKQPITYKPPIFTEKTLKTLFSNLDIIQYFTPNTTITITLSPPISARVGHKTVSINKDVYLFGGYDGTNFLNDFYKINTITSNVTTLYSNTNNKISKRVHHTMVAINTDIYIFGGNNGITPLNDFYKIDTITNDIIYSNIIDISKRYGHSMSKINNDIIITGGFNGTTTLNDFYKIDTTNCNVVYSNNIIGMPNRVFHTMVTIDNEIIIFGGTNDINSIAKSYNDFYKINTSNSHILYSNNIMEISERFYHTMVSINTDIYIFGGFNDTNYLNDFYKIDTNCNITTLYSNNDPSNIITIRREHSMVTLNNDIIIFGGYNGINPLNDFYKLTYIPPVVIPPVIEPPPVVIPPVVIPPTPDPPYIDPPEPIIPIEIIDPNNIPIKTNSITLAPSIPTRRLHSTVTLNNDVYIFGGKDNNNPLNDLYRIDTLTCNVTTLYTNDNSIGIPKRYGHSMTVLSNDLYIFGGTDGINSFNDLYKIDTTMYNITKLYDDNTLNISKRQYHSMVSINKDIYIFGGESNNVILNDFYKIEQSDNTLGPERLYPSSDARAYSIKYDVNYIYKNFIVTNTYANGLYSINFSTYDTTYSTSPTNIFYKPNVENNPYESRDSFWAARQYINGTYDSSIGNSIGGIYGDWISIKMPVKILLTKYIFVVVSYYSTTMSGAPKEYSIFGRNDNDDWEKIISDTISSTTNYNLTYDNVTNIAYQKILTTPLTGTKMFNTFGLVVNKIFNSDVLLMAEWELYGKEIQISYNITKILDNNSITPRDNHKMLAINNDIIIFGGKNKSIIYSDIYKINTITCNITYSNSHIGIPKRYGHSMTSLNSNIYLFGGSNYTGILNDYYKIDTLTCNVTRFYSNTNTLIPKRMDNSLISVNNDIIIFGGYDGTTTLNDSYKITDIITPLVPTIPTIPTIPTTPIEPVIVPNKPLELIPLQSTISARNFHSMVTINPNIYVFGGKDSSQSYNDFYKINTLNCNISKLYDNGNTSISKRNGHSMVTLSNDIYIFGGTDGTTVFNDFYKIDSLTNNIIYSNTNFEITKRYNHTMVSIDNDIYIFGGQNGTINYLNDFYKISIGDTVITYGSERLYPSSYARQNFFITNGFAIKQYNVTNTYANGVYNIDYPTNTYNQSVTNVFYKPLNGTWGLNQYNSISGDYITNINALNNVYGEWITIELPVKILLTRHIFVPFNYINIGQCPKNYIIFGRNNVNDVWEKIIEETITINDYNTVYETYGNIAYDKTLITRLTGNKMFNTFGLVVNKIIGSYTSLAMAEWEIYGKEVAYYTLLYNITNVLFNTITGRINHTMVAIYNDIYIFGGIDNNYTSYNDFYKIDTLNCNIVYSNVNTIIPARYGHSMTAVNSNIYIFGGSNGISTLNDYYKIDTLNCNITTLHNNTATNVITARTNHSMVALNNEIYIFGGFNNSVLNNFYKIIYDIAYIAPEPEPIPELEPEPEPELELIPFYIPTGSIKLTITPSMPFLYSHSMVSIKNDIYVFGGINNATYVNSFYKIDALTCNIVYSDNNFGISKRRDHSMVAIKNDLYIFGGYNGINYLNDFYKIDTLTCNITYSKTFTEIDGRNEHTMVAIKNDIYIFGGFNPNSAYLSDFYKINTLTCNIVYTTNDIGVSKRHNHTMVAINKDIYIFGGYNNTGYLNDFYKINTLNCNLVYSSNNVGISARINHNMVAINSNIYILGGENSTAFYKDYYRIDTTNCNITTIYTNSTGNVIPNNRLFGMTAINNDIYIFGGYTDEAINDFYKITNDIYYIPPPDPDAFYIPTVSIKLETTPSIPIISPYYMAAIKNDIYIYESYKTGLLNTLYKIDTLTNKIVYSNNIRGISSRVSTMMVAINNDLYIFGGFDLKNYLNDFYKINTLTCNVSYSNIIPNIPGRRNHNMITIGNDIYIFGGFNIIGYEQSYLNDFHKISTLTCNVSYSKTFTEIQTRQQSSMAAINNDIYIFGGYNDGSFLNDFYKINTLTCNVSYINNNFGISKRRNHSMVAINSNLYIFGGYYYANSIGVKYNDYYRIDSTNCNISTIYNNSATNVIPVKSGHSMTTIGNDIYIFGDNGVINDFYKITKVIEYIPIPDPIPEPTPEPIPFYIPTKSIKLTITPPMPFIYQHSMVSIKNDIYIFGGFYSTTYLNSFYKIDSLTCNIVYSNNNFGISKRRNHSMVAIGNDIYVFGGYDDASYFKDFYKINTLTCNATYIKNFNEMQGRSSTTMVAINTDIYIFGGYNTSYLNDFYKIDTKTNNIVYSTNTIGISQRDNHTMAAINKDIYIYGGYNNITGTLKDFYKINTLTCNIVYSNNNIGISERINHNMVAINSNIYIFGGITISNNYLNDFYRIDTTMCNITTIYNNNTGNVIPDKRQFGMTAINNDIYIYGGLTKGVGNNFTNDFFKITKE